MDAGGSVNAAHNLNDIEAETIAQPASLPRCHDGIFGGWSDCLVRSTG
jgi:hypothetical protein